MIRGAVNARREAIVPLRLRGPGGIELDVSALIDTGYTGSLTLSSATIATLGLSLHSFSSAQMADGSTRQFEIFAAELLWDGTWRNVLVSSIGMESLIGMRILEDHELRVQVVSGGAVEISRLP